MNKNKRRFKLLIEPHAEKLYIAAYRLTGNQADADDLLQETLLKAYRALDSLKDERNPAGWVYRILKNSYLNALAKNKNRPRLFDDPLQMDHVPAVEPSDHSLDGLDERLQAVLQDIPEDMRFMLIAREVEGLTYQEIATMFGLSMGTVKSRINRSRETLKEKYLKKNENSV